MKRLLKILLTIIIILAVLSIIRVQPERIAYGHYAGECVGNCGTIYEVYTKVLRVDTTSFWQTRSDLGKLQIIGQRPLEDDDEGTFCSKKLNVPLIMLIDPRKVFGCPDCHDQGGYYLDYTLFGIRRYYEIDKGSAPLYYRSLTKDIDKKMEEVNAELVKYGE